MAAGRIRQSQAIRYLTTDAPERFVDTFRLIAPNALGTTFGAAGKVDYITWRFDLDLQLAISPTPSRALGAHGVRS